MFKSWRLGKLFDIPFYVHPTTLMIPALVILGNSGIPLPGLAVALLVVAIFGCVLLHELGHALMARAFGIGTRSITLYPIGGVARLDRMPEQPSRELAIAIAGPLVNVGIAVILLLVLLVLSFIGGALGGGGLFVSVGTFLAFLLGANVCLAVFNLLPAFPMDGGRVLRALLSMGMGPLRATEIAVKVGFVIAILIGLAALYTGNWMLPVLAVFVIIVGQMELLAMRHRERLTQPAPVYGPPPGPVITDGPRPTSRPGEPGFSGVAWDSSSQVWIQWQNGRPVGYFARAR